MFSALFASCAVLAKATAGGPTGAQLFDQRNVALETAFLLLSSYTCGLMSMAVNSRRYFGTFLGAGVTVLLGAAFLTLELREFQGMIAIGATPQRSAFLSAFAGRLSRNACDGRTDLAGAHDGSARDVGFSPRCRTPHALLRFVLARPGHHLGRDIYCGLSDGSPWMSERRWDVAPGERPKIPASAQSKALLLACLSTRSVCW
jgi:hypothetical protein